MDEPDDVDYGDSDSDFADLEVDLDDETDAVPQQEAASQPVDAEPGILCSDKEEGEATPRASPLVADTGASSELEDGEFLMDSEPMQLEEAASAHEAASKRQPDVGDSSSGEEEGRRRREQHRHRRSPEERPGRASTIYSKHLDRARDTARRSRGRERDRRDEGRGNAVPLVRGLERHPVPSQGFRHGYSDVQSLVRVGSYPPSHLAPRGHMLDPELSRHHPHPHASRPGVPVRPAFGPPLEIRAGSSLAVQSVRSGQGNTQVHIVYQLSAEGQQHLHPAPHVLPPPPAARQPPLRPPIVSHAAFDLRPPFGGPPLHPGGLHPLPILAGGPSLNPHRGPLVDTGPFRQGSRPFDAQGRDPVPPHARNEHLHRGHSNSPGGEFPRGTRPPKDLPRGGSGRMESLRAQLEDQGNLGRDPPRVRLDGHRSAVPPLPPPPARRADERALTSRSPPAPARRADERALTSRSPPAPARRADERALTSRSPPPPARRADERALMSRSPPASARRADGTALTSRSPPPPARRADERALMSRSPPAPARRADEQALTSRSPPAPARRADERVLTSRSPPPPARRADEWALTSRSPPAEANGKGEVSQRPSSSPELENVAKRQESEGGRGDVSKERVMGQPQERSPHGNGGRSPGKSKSGGKERGGSSKREKSDDGVQEPLRSPGVGKNLGSEKQPSTSDVKREPTVERAEGTEKSREEDGTSSIRAEANGKAENEFSGRGSTEPHRSGSDPHRSASRSSQELRKSDDASRVTKRRREDDARDSEEKEKEAREKEMRHRALQILEAGRNKKRKERDEERRNDPRGHEPGPSGREGYRPGLPGSRRDGKAQRNYRRRSEFDDNDERSRSRSQGRGDSPEQLRRRSADLWDERPPRGPHKPNGVDRNGRGGQSVGGDGNGRSRGGLWADRDNGLGDGHTQPNSRRVVVELGAIDRRPDLPRFSDRDRDFATGKHAARESPGPPGFEQRAPAQRPRLGGNPESRTGRLGDPDRAAGLERSGSGAVVSVGARQPSKTLAVNNLPENFKSGHILDMFKKYGPVQLVRQTGKSSVEVTFRREDEAKAARANVHRMIKLEGREVLVEYKAPVPA